MSPKFQPRPHLKEIDPDVYALLEREEQRQDDTIILIASESESHPAIHETIASGFAHVYAEGYPREASRKQTQSEILDHGAELAHYRRNSDPRYYKGVENADVLEALTRRRAAELFAANGIKPSNLFVNVQALSGGPANNAVYTALIQPGDTIMGLKLTNGGHLSHGAAVNRSGLVYNSVSYGVDPTSEKLDYDAIEKMALDVKPQIIVAGFSAYPLIIDWQRFREIADKVGAYFLADIAHISGLVASGMHPSPIGIADIVSTTTHKSLCGPRGAMIMTHHKKLASKIDKAVFPGEQGGPHLNTMAALAVALKMAASDDFNALQKRIVENATRLAQKLEAGGIRIPFGGSENHLLLVDTKSRRVDGVPLTGDMAARILDCVGIVVNYNTIPGDKSPLNPFGLRLGTVWPSQHGFGDAEIDQLAEAIITIFNGTTPIFYRGSKGKMFRAKVSAESLQTARNLVDTLTGKADRISVNSEQLAVTARGKHVTRFLNYALTSDVLALGAGETHPTHIVMPSGSADALLAHTDSGYTLTFADAKTAANAQQWLSDLSDGYVDFGNLHGKLPGPIVVDLAAATAPTLSSDAAAFADNKPYFIGSEQRTGGDPLPEFSWSAPESDELKVTNLHQTHIDLGGKMVPFGGWDMPVWYSSVSDEHAAVRTAAGLFDVSHMGAFDVKGAGSAEFLNTVLSNDIYRLAVGKSHYTYLMAPDGRIIDDLLVYRRGADDFMLVVNASNNDEDWAWLNAVNNGEVMIDADRPWAKVQTSVQLRDLRDLQHGADCRVDLALQGPRSTDILLALIEDDALATRLKSLKWGGLTQGMVAGLDVIISRTGYTGERVAYELFVHPDKAVEFWNAMLKAGEPMGLLPVGLAARDSTRTEAGLPLHGHELAGTLDLDPLEAGFPTFVKVDKPFFVGRSAYVKRMLANKRTVVRFRMEDKGVRRPETNDPILDKRGKVVGRVTSCAIDRDGYLLGLAVVPLDMRKVGTRFPLYQTGGGKRALKVSAEIKDGSRLPLPNMAVVISRFPKR